MKKIIGKKVYNTETATEVASWDNGSFGRDLDSCAEALFLTKKGAWFLFGEGGPRSRYFESVGDRYTGGSDLVPLSEEGAYAWLEDKQEYKAIVEYFPNIIKDA
jgi:hypothetical protein